MRNTMVLQARLFAAYPRLARPAVFAELAASVECKAANVASSCMEAYDVPLSPADAHFITREDDASLTLFGVDPDVSGAVALLHRGGNGISAQVIDVPSVNVAVGKTTRRRHDARSIVAILNRLEVPEGSVAYIEESRPFPKDGKLGWYGSGFGYGIWTGVLVALGFSVVPVRSQAWKAAMGLAGTQCTKDDSRALACSLFPSLAPQLRRKKDHGRAEALLIAAFGTTFQWSVNSLVPPK